MLFKNIINACLKEHPLSVEEIAKHTHASVEEVKEWIEGTALPDHHQLEHFSMLFALPLKVLENAQLERRMICKKDV